MLVKVVAVKVVRNDGILLILEKLNQEDFSDGLGVGY